MSKVVQWKRGNTSATTSYTGYEGEITVNTDTWNLHVHDVYTPGGWIIDSSNGGGEFGNLSAGNVAVTSAITTNTLVATGNVTADYFIGNGSLLTGISSYSDANVVAYSEAGFAGNIIPSANVTYTLGNATNQWASLYVSGNTIYLDNTPLSISGNMLAVNGTMIADHTYTDATVNSAIATANAGMKSYVDNEISTTVIDTNTAISANLTTAQNYADSAIANLVASAPSTLDTLNEIAAALGNDPNLSATLTSSIGNVSSNVSAIQADYANITYVGDTVNTANTNMKSYVDNEISGIGAHYNDANVVSLLSDFGSNTVVTTGNVTAGNIIGTFVGLSNVATSGSYNDLSNKPTIPSNLDDLSDVSVASANSGDMLKFISGVGWIPAPLAIVATTGSYNNLTDKPTLFSGSYDDLTSKPTIPSLGNYTITDNTIQTSSGVEGITLSIFGADQAVPDPAFISRSWLFANTGAFTSPGAITVTSGNLNATGAVLTGNLTSGNLNTGKLITSSSLHVNSFASIAAQMTAYSLVVNTTSTFGGNVSATNISANGNITGTTNGYTIGYKDIPQLSLSGNVTLADTDGGKHYYSANATATITIPNNATTSFAIGTAISVVQEGTATLTVAPDSGVTLYLAGNSTSGSRTIGSYGMATLMKVATDTWFINGTGVA